MLIIDEGKKMVEGSVATLIDPAKTLLEATVVNPKEAANLLESTGWYACIQKVTHDSLIFQLPKDQIPGLNRELVRLQIPVLSLQVKNSLEAYFLSLTRNSQYVEPFTD
jgi:ABC-2 type transport system ATP-binding protein